VVTSDDYVAVDVGLGQNPGTSQWIQGDFDFNGFVTSDDYVAIDVNLGKGTPVAPLALFADDPSAILALEQDDLITPVATDPVVKSKAPKKGSPAIRKS
jgi:hypothetical protein